MSGKCQHSKHYCYRYTFSSKIECGICGSNYVHRTSGNKKELNKLYNEVQTLQKRLFNLIDFKLD